MGDYGYPNARVRAWKSYLFDKDIFEKLLSAKNFQDSISILNQTKYETDIEEGLSRKKGVAGIDEGLKIHLSKTLTKLHRIVKDNKEAGHYINLLLTKWDIYNLKTVLRGYHANATENEIFDSLIPAGSIDEVALRILSRQPSIKAAIDQLIVLKPQYADPLLMGYRAYRETKVLAELELALDKFYYKSVLLKTKVRSKNARIINEVIQRNVDFINIMTLLRLTQEPALVNIDIGKYFIEGGKDISRSKFLDIAKIDEIKDKIEALRFTSYYDCLNQGLKKYIVNSALSNIERSLEDFNTKKVVALFRGDPLGISIIVAFLWAKINEIVNIRIIFRGKDIDMPPKDIKEALVFV